MTALPQFRDWTVDMRLHEFRRADPDRGMETLPFETSGADLYTAYLVATSPTHAYQLAYDVAGELVGESNDSAETAFAKLTFVERLIEAVRDGADVEVLRDGLIAQYFDIFPEEANA